MLRISLLLVLLLAPLRAWTDAPSPGALARATVSESFGYEGGSIKVLLLDADQTLRVSTKRLRAPRSPSEVVLLPGVREKIADYRKQGYFVAIMSNQQNPVRDTGLSQIDATMQETVRQIQRGSEARIDYYDFAKSEAEAKPGTTMVDRLAAALKAKLGAAAEIDRAHSLMVGDAAYLPTETRPDGRPGFDTANFDRKFAENNGLGFEEPQNFFGWRARGVDRIESVADLESYENRPAGCAGLFGVLAVP